VLSSARPVPAALTAHDALVSTVTVGLPGAGKSRVINYRYVLDRQRRRKLKSTVVLDLDLEIAQHPQFDPENPDKLYLAGDQEAYRWADARVEARFLSGLGDPSVKRLVVDGTGTNVERQVRRMKQARDAGFFVKALYVRVPAKTAIARAAMRKRGVSPKRIQAYQQKMRTALSVAAEHADEVETFDVTFDDAPLPGTGYYVDPGSVTTVVT
jgi:predicted ABC-type ATPase